jgi:hypothetical protein
LHHDSHSFTADSEYCHTCGQKLPTAGENYGTWNRKPQSNRIGIGVSIALHLLGVLYYLLKPAPDIHLKPPSKEGTITYIEPLQPVKKIPQKPQKTAEAKASKPPPPRKQAAAITPPATSKPKLETFVPPVQATMQPPPEQDLSELIAKRRAARNAANPQPTEPAPETAEERGQRIARANIAGAQAKSGTGGTSDDGGGVFSVDKSYHSAEVKFRGWNANFKRRWPQQVHVDQGAEQDIETAIVKKMIEMIRKEKPGDFEWESHRLGKVVPMSARKEDEKELFAFLMKEMFPEYTKGGR